jgi:hypothetical protein
MPNGVQPPRKQKVFGDGNENGSARPLSNPIRKGYGVRTPSIYPRQANALLVNQTGQYLYLYATDFQTGAEMSGSAVQSKNVRQFFPNEFVQPRISLSCIAPDNHQYNRFANFVRVSHNLAVNGRQSERLVTFRLFNRDRDGNQAFPYEGGRRNGRQITKGVHADWHVRGWIEAAEAGGEKENHAPEFQFDFVIVQSIKSPLGPDQLLTGADLEDWMSYFYGLSKEDRKSFVRQKKKPSKKPAKQETKKADGFAFGIPSIEDSPFDSYGDDPLPGYGFDEEPQIGPYAEGYGPDPNFE